MDKWSYNCTFYKSGSIVLHMNFYLVIILLWIEFFFFFFLGGLDLFLKLKVIKDKFYKQKKIAQLMY